MFVFLGLFGLFCLSDGVWVICLDLLFGLMGVGLRIAFVVLGCFVLWCFVVGFGVFGLA